MNLREEIKHKLSQSAFFLDFDGTLCPHVEEHEVKTYNPWEIYETVKHLDHAGAKIFWNTGRRLESLASVHQAFLDFDGYFIQGTVFWDAQAKEAHYLSPPISQEEVFRFKDLVVAYPQYKLEVKKTSLRLSPSVNVTKDQCDFNIVNSQSDFYPPKGWCWHVGARGAELLSVHFDKSTALKDHHKKNPNAFFIAAGDDAFDRMALEEALHLGGIAISVGPHIEWTRSLSNPSRLLHFEHAYEFMDFLKSLRSI